MLMKQHAKTKSVLAGATLLGLLLLPGAVKGQTAWLAAGILGLAALGFSASLRQPKPAPVRIRSQRRRF